MPRPLPFALVLLPLFAASLRAQAAPSVARVGPARVAVLPGGQVTAAFRVRAPAGTAARLEPSLPAGWRAVFAPAPLPAGTGDVRLVGAIVPRGAAAGTYVLRLRASSGGATAADSVRVEVGERRALEVSIDQAPRFAVAGEPYAAVFGVANRGNARAAVRVAVTSSRGWPAAADAASLELEPGERRAVRVTVRTRPAAGAATHLLRLTATAGTDAAARGSALARVAVVARGSSGAGSGRSTLPARVTLRARQGGAVAGGLPASFSASGPVGTGGTRVDAFYRGRGAAAPERGEAEQLSLSLRGPRGELLAGDQFWALSPLTAPGRAAFGAGGRLIAGPGWVEGFTARDRFGSPRTAGAAIGVGGSAASLAAQYAAAAGGGAVSLRGRARLGEGLSLDAEYGAAGAARGANLELRGGGKAFRFSARALEADAGFPGDQAGRSLRRVELAARPAGALRLYGGYARDTRVDTAEYLPGEAGVRVSTLRAGASLGGRATVEWRAESRAGVAAGGPWARDAASWVATATLRARHASLSGGAQVGGVRDRATGARSPFGREWLRAEARVGAQSVRAGVERRVGSLSAVGVQRPRLTGELGVTLQPWASTLLTATAAGGGAGWALEDDGVVDARVEQRLPGGHALRLQLRATPWAEPGRRAPTVLLDYEIPLRLPLGRATQRGTIGGRVMDRETGRPIPGALVRVEERAVMTDGRGRWAVEGLAAGPHRVEVDAVSIGVGRVAVLPDALVVAGSRRVPVEIGVSRAATLRGEIALPGGGGVAGAVVELRSGDERRRQMAGADGRFVFSGLPPGRWTVTVDADLPPHHALEPRTLEVELSAGEEGRAEFRAVERHREMRIVAGGDVMLGAPPVRGAAPAVPPSAVPAAPSITTPAPMAAPAVSSATMPAPPAPSATAPAPGSAPAPSPARAPAPRRVEPAPAAREAERPWRTRGESGLTDWAEDSYVIQPGDADLVAVAWFVYRDGTLWPKLWLANRDRLPTPNALRAGLELIVPPFGPLTAEERAAAAAWRRARQGGPR